MNRNSHIHQLFNRLLDNSISENELQELLDHLGQPEWEDELKALMEAHWDDVKEMDLATMPDYRTNKRLAEILKKAGRRQVVISMEDTEVSGGRSTSYQWIGIAASMLVLLSVGIYWFANFYGDSQVPITEESATTRYDGKQVVHLPDGSKVILNEGSHLSFGSTFGDESREVVFSGEGYFNIAHDSSRPFVVHTGQVNTTVLGTAFNLTAYEGQSEIKVTVERGEVAVGDGKRIYDHILPKQQLIVNKLTKEFEKKTADLNHILAWKEQFLILEETTITEAASLIGARYRVEVVIANDEVKDCTINAAFMHGESLEQVIQVISGVLQAEYTLTEDRVEIKGGRKCN